MRPSNPTNIVIQNKYVEVTERDLYNFWIQSKENILKNVTNNVESSRNGTFPLDITIDNISYLNEKEDGTSIYRVKFKKIS